MKIIVLHGDDSLKSFERLKKFEEVASSRSWEVSDITESNLSLIENLSSTSLFAKERFFILRDIKILGKREIDWLKKNYQNLAGTLIIYHEGIIGQILLKSLSEEVKIEEFKLPKLIWNFLDSIYPENNKLIVQFHRVIEREPVEFVFSLISNLFRDILWVSQDSDLPNYPSWRLTKLKGQARKFSSEKLEELIAKLSTIDFNIKTGQGDLVSSLDLFIIKYLK